jgi:flagellar hook-length control protein FliK
MVKSQITDHFNLKISNANKVELHLHTEEYGSLKINFEKKDNGIIEVKIETDQSKTKSHELSGAMNEVKQELKEKGFDIRFDFQDNNSNNKENAREQEKRKEEYTAPKNTDNVDENDESKFSEQFMKVIGGI